MHCGAATRVRPAGLLAGLAVATATLVATTLAPAHAHQLQDANAEGGSTSALYLVTLNGPGTAGSRGSGSGADQAAEMRQDQDDLLDAVDATDPAYRWTTALNGFAVELDADQARTLTGDRRVARVEKDSLRSLSTLDPAALRSATAATSAPAAAAGSGGAGTVIGFVDTGIDPNHRAFSDVTPLGRAPRFTGECATASADPSWNPGDCSRKIVGARHFVDGFGTDAIRSGERLSPSDTSGHGTAMASIAAATSTIPVRVAGHSLGQMSGAAPQARIAAYKACWSAPDPHDDGCSTADLVAAIDQATTDQVDVLNLAVGGPAEIDTVERALLGATEAGILVVGAAGNRGDRAYAAHPSPWVMTVGATTGAERVGTVALQGGPRLSGAMASNQTVRSARLVYADSAVAPGATTDQARTCQPGSLDARRVAGAVVVCERGDGARVDKSGAVQRADGAGMILVNLDRGSTDADLHSLPTVHLSATDAAVLAKWARGQQAPQVSLVSHGIRRAPARVAAYSCGGDPTLPQLKPDLVAPGTGVIAAVPGGWDLASGTSAAAARVSGAAATLLARPGATAVQVRSALRSTAVPLARSQSWKSGAGLLSHDPALPDVGYLIATSDYRSWLSGRQAQLNLAHVLLSGDRVRASRTLTNTSDRVIDISASTTGFTSPAHVFPSYAELAPGDTLTFTVTVTAGRGTDEGAVVWRSATGSSTRLTVVKVR